MIARIHELQYHNRHLCWRLGSRGAVAYNVLVFYRDALQRVPAGIDAVCDDSSAVLVRTACAYVGARGTIATHAPFRHTPGGIPCAAGFDLDVPVGS